MEDLLMTSRRLFSYEAAGSNHRCFEKQKWVFSYFHLKITRIGVIQLTRMCSEAAPNANGSIEIMHNPSKPHADKFRSDTITPHVKCRIHLIKPYAGCNRRTKN